MSKTYYPPPKTAKKLMQIMALPGERFSVVGDLQEEFNEIAEIKSKFKAHVWYWFQVLKASGPFFLYRMKWFLTMFHNYLKITIRSLNKNKTYSFINITGLALGMVISMFILLWVQDELSYDRFHKNHERLYRLIAKGRNFPFAPGPAPTAPFLKNNYQEIEDAFRIYGVLRIPFKQGKESFEEATVIVDDSFFKIMSFPFISGDRETALTDPYSVVISQKIANKFFKNENPLGKILLFSAKTPLKVTGIINNIPHNSHINADVFIPFNFLRERRFNVDSWNRDIVYTYVLVHEGISVASLNSKIKTCIKRHRDKDYKASHYLQPLKDVHLHSAKIRFDFAMHGNVYYVYIFATVAFFILVIACINFMNLATARSAGRAQEVGVRKVVGARRKQLITQFFTENILMSLLSAILAMLLIAVLYPLFENFSGKPLPDNFLGQSGFLLGILGISLSTGILSAIYPALFLSSFKPVNVLKGSPGTVKGRSLSRKILVVTQFSLSVLLIICTAVVTNQLKYLKNAELGYDTENIMYLRMRGAFENNYSNIRNQLLANVNVLGVTASSFLPHNVGERSGGHISEKYQVEDGVDFSLLQVSENFIETYNIKMDEGRFFSPLIATDERETVILNESAARAMGILSFGGKKLCFSGQCYRIIGVIKDFHHSSLHKKLEPLVIQFRKENLRYLSIKFKSGPGNLQGIIKSLRDLWKRYSPDLSFQIDFLNETLNNQYRFEQRLERIFTIFAGLAIAISCLGLFGLASYSIERRIKEIGIRKTLGASVASIVTLLTGEFTKWIMLANLIAWPVSYILMKNWLARYPYRTSITTDIFLLSALISLGVALFTVSYHSIRAACADPVDSLKYE